MSDLFGALDASASTLGAYQQALDLVQNNVGNASTPGYAAQQATFSPLPFDSVGRESGGVVFSGAQSMRNELSESYLQQQNSDLGSANALVSSLSQLQTAFDISGDTGISAALTAFYTSFTQLSSDPNSPTARQQVLDAAGDVARAFQETSSSVTSTLSAVNQQIESTVSQVNGLASDIADLNQVQRESPGADPNLDARIHSDLQSLSNFTNFTYAFSADGTVSVLIDGQTPLVSGATVHPIAIGAAHADSASPEAGAAPALVIQDSNGADITNQLSAGELGGLLTVRNQTIPGLVGDDQQTGTLNQLAKSFADRVNDLLTSGQVSAGPPPVPGAALFQYDSSSTARTLEVTGITPDQIATIDPGPPSSANGTALRIGDLASSANPQDQLDGLTFSEFYGQIAATVGGQLSDATTTQTNQSQVVAQAQNMLQQVSGVSLDAEAVQLTEFQRGYEATSKLISVLSDLTETTINLIQS